MTICEIKQFLIDEYTEKYYTEGILQVFLTILQVISNLFYSMQWTKYNIAAPADEHDSKSNTNCRAYTWEEKNLLTSLCGKKKQRKKTQVLYSVKQIFSDLQFHRWLNFVESKNCPVSQWQNILKKCIHNSSPDLETEQEHNIDDMVFKRPVTAMHCTDTDLWKARWVKWRWKKRWTPAPGADRRRPCGAAPGTPCGTPDPGLGCNTELVLSQNTNASWHATRTLSVLCMTFLKIFCLFLSCLMSQQHTKRISKTTSAARKY